MTCPRNQIAVPAAACLTVLLMLLSSSCSSTSSSAGGLPSNLPNIHLDGGTATPAHTMQSYEYPFDSSGRYVSEWAAEGERRSGRSASATNDDGDRWNSSHGGSSSGKRKVASSTPSKSKTSAKARSKTTVSASTSAKAKAKSSSGGGGRSYTVKKGDTLGHIAAKNGTSVAKIKAANGMSSDFLSIGKVLRIP